MKTLTKTIICGLAAFALYACSSDNSTSPEHTGTATTQTGIDKGAQQVSLGPSEEDAYIETILEGKPISNMIAVDPPLCVNDTDGVEWCPPYRVKTESGTLLHAWGGISETIYCERASDTISLDVFLHNNRIRRSQARVQGFLRQRKRQNHGRYRKHYRLRTHAEAAQYRQGIHTPTRRRN